MYVFKQMLLRQSYRAQRLVLNDADSSETVKYSFILYVDVCMCYVLHIHICIFLIMLVGLCLLQVYLFDYKM